MAQVPILKGSPAAIAERSAEGGGESQPAGIVSVLVCTRNRPSSVLQTVRSLLATDAPRFELIVIDQSDDCKTEQALRAPGADPRLRYVHVNARGKGAALNEGLRRSRGDIVVCTDDDCEAPVNWAVDMTRTLDARPTAAVLFCNVTAVSHDTNAGYVPAYTRESDRFLRTVASTRHGLGLGAGMALRRQAVLAFGGFDEAFGPGSRFPSGDDWDISLRALLHGWHIYETAQIAIVHNGFRTFEEGRDHALRDWISIGAVWAKPIRGGHVGAIMPVIWYFFKDAVRPSIRDTWRLRRLSGRSRIVGFFRGLAAGLRAPVDRTLRFKVTEESTPQRTRGVA